MNNDLAKVFRELEHEKQTPDIKRIRKNTEDRLNDKLREHFLSVVEIGGIIGYDKLEKQMAKALALVAKLKKK
jgi:hypothetical protein